MSSEQPSSDFEITPEPPPKKDQRFKDFDIDLKMLKARLQTLLFVIRNTNIITIRSGDAFVFGKLKNAERVLAEKQALETLSTDMQSILDKIGDLASIVPEV